jgi:hypothetical protein
MAQTFNILNWEKNHQLNRYFARIDFKGSIHNYEIIATGANVRYLDWIDKLSILDGFDQPFNGELPIFKITGLSDGARKNEKSLENAFYEFIRTECSEDYAENKLLKTRDN